MLNKMHLATWINQSNAQSYKFFGYIFKLDDNGKFSNISLHNLNVYGLSQLYKSQCPLYLHHSKLSNISTFNVKRYLPTS